MMWFRRFVQRMKNYVARERRMFPRYDVREQDDARAFFSIEGAAAYVQDPSNPVEQPHPIINLSKGGIALFLLEGDDPEYFRTHSRVDLNLYIEGQLMKISCEVAYAVGGLRRVGLKFVDLTDRQLEFISQFLDEHFLASSMREIPLDRQKIRGQICRWYHGMNNTELFSWRKVDGQMIRHLFIFVDRVVEWSEPDGLRTGTVMRPDYALTQTTIFDHNPNPIQYDDARNDEVVEEARSIVALTEIDPEIKEHLLTTLS